MRKSNHQWQVRVYYEDTDAGGIVYHANYLKFLERARTEWLRTFGFEQDILLEQNLAFVVRSMELEFAYAAKFNQILSIHTQIVQLSGASMVFKQIITNDDDKECFSALVKVASVNIETMKPCRIPTFILGEFKRVI
jgi:acyl-CoA thioester hydrolase